MSVCCVDCGYNYGQAHGRRVVGTNVRVSWAVSMLAIVSVLSLSCDGLSYSEPMRLLLDGASQVRRRRGPPLSVDDEIHEGPNAVAETPAPWPQVRERDDDIKPHCAVKESALGTAHQAATA
jgi:hypothetical protein